MTRGNEVVPQPVGWPPSADGAGGEWQFWADETFGSTAAGRVFYPKTTFDASHRDVGVEW